MTRARTSRIAFFLASTALLAGCESASVFEDKDKAFRDVDRAPEKVIEPEVRRFARREARTKKTIEKDMLVQAEGGDIPPEILNKRLSYKYLSGLGMGSFATLLQQKAGIQMALTDEQRVSADTETAEDAGGSSSASADVDPASLSLPTGNFDGCFGQFLNLANRVHGLAFDYSQGTLFVDQAATYTLSLPQDKELLETVKGKIESLGGSDVVVSTQSAQISYAAHPRANRQRIVPYLKQLRENLAMITIQAALVNVRVSKDRERGLDWGNTSISFADQDRLSALSNQQNNNANQNPGNNPNNPNNPNVPSNSNSDDSLGVSQAIQRGVGQVLSAGASGVTGETVFNVTNDLVGIATAFAWLENLGRTRTSQSLELSTIAGSEVSLRSGTTEPFVSEVGVGNVGGNNNTGGTNVGTVDTETIETGLEVTFGTNYDRRSRLVTVDVSLTQNILQEFKELSAGNQFGTITQPVTQDREFEDKLRLRVGDTAVIGGLRDLTQENSSRGPEFTGPPLRREAKDKTQDALFIVLRPVVTEYHLEKTDGIEGMLDPRYTCEADG